MLGGLTAVHDGAIPYMQGYGYRPEQAFPKNEHPVVVRHPETGRKVLFVNRGFTSHIVQLARFESAALLELLYRVIETQPVLQCRVRWTPNTLVLWDNRCTQHHAVWDYYPLARAGKRVSVIGSRPVA
jgi:taurine dioxygenase